MVRKISAVIVCVLLIATMVAPVHAYTHQVYDGGALSGNYLTYYKDILSGVPFKDNYVAFRDSQYSYIMVVGELECNGEIITLKEQGKAYIFRTENQNYGSQYRYYVEDISNFSVDTNNYIVYSDVGDYPQLMERGAKYEVVTAVLIVISLLCVVIGRIFRKR